MQSPPPNDSRMVPVLATLFVVGLAAAAWYFFRGPDFRVVGGATYDHMCGALFDVCVRVKCPILNEGTAGSQHVYFTVQLDGLEESRTLSEVVDIHLEAGQSTMAIANFPEAELLENATVSCRVD